MSRAKQCLGVFLFSVLFVSPRTGQELSVQVFEQARSDGFKGSFFPPDDDVKTLLIDMIDRECAKIQLSVFRFTDRDIADALLRAHERRVIIEIIADADSLGRFSKVRLLHDRGIAVYVYPPIDAPSEYSLEHSKCILFHKVRVRDVRPRYERIMWTGSLNLTAAGFTKNQEHVVVLDDPVVVEPCFAQFERLKKRATRL